MKNWITLSATIAGSLVCASLALAQAKPAECPKPEKVEGQVVQVDKEHGKLTLRGSDGKMYEFNGSKEALQDKKVGDRMEVTRRMPEGCKTG
jgi:hypothetical protein